MIELLISSLQSVACRRCVEHYDKLLENGDTDTRIHYDDLIECDRINFDIDEMI